MILHAWMQDQISLQAVDEVRGNLRVVQDLEGDDTFELSRRLSNDVGEIAVEGEQDRIQSLGLRHDGGVWRLDRQTIFETPHFVTSGCKGLDDEIRDAVVREKAERHQAVTSNSARSRA